MTPDLVIILVVGLGLPLYLLGFMRLWRALGGERAMRVHGFIDDDGDPLDDALGPAVQATVNRSPGVPDTLRRLFDRLDGPGVERFDATIRVRGPRASETLAILSRCYTSDPAAVIEWLLAKEQAATGADRAWLARILVDTLGDVWTVRRRAKGRVQPVLGPEPVTEARAEVALDWTPALGGSAIAACTRIVTSDVDARLRATALARLGDRDPDRAADLAADLIRDASTAPAEVGPVLRAEAVRQATRAADLAVLVPLADLVEALDRTAGEDADDEIVTVLDRTARLVDRVGDAPVPLAVRARYAEAMQGPWWAAARRAQLRDAIHVLGCVDPPGLTAFLVEAAKRVGGEQANEIVQDLLVIFDALGRWGDLTAVAPLHSTAHAPLVDRRIRRAAERAIAQIQDRCATGDAGGLAVTEGDGALAVVSAVDASASR